jgi:putative sterol carrier protein
MSLDPVIDRLRRRAADFAGLDARIKFVLEDEGAVLIDATSMPPVIAAGNGGEADCTIRLSRATLEQLLDGGLGPMWAYTTGRLKVEGSLGVAMKLASRLEE